MAATAHGNPSPKKTFTEFEPVIFPIAESANSEVLAAVILANVSGKDVPKATRVIAVTDSSMPKTHPNIVAISPTKAVTIPMYNNDTINAALPPHIPTGGTVANNTFQLIIVK